MVGGAPLERGKGWRIWYALASGAEPRPLSVELAGSPQKLRQNWEEVGRDPVQGRVIGIHTVRLADPKPGSLYKLSVPELSEPLMWRSLPADLEAGVTFLMASCFWRDADKEGSYGAGVADLTRLVSPHFKLLMGDQVYQDFPIRLDMTRSAYEHYSDRYATYWGDGAVRQVLSSSPGFFACDDHEFWNNYPEAQIQTPLTHSEFRRADTQKASLELYDLYQASANPGGARFFDFRIELDRREPGRYVSFFVADTRSERTRFKADAPYFFTDDQWTALEGWVGDLRGPGLLVLPQPLFQAAGDWKDYSLANFKSGYARLCDLFTTALDGRTGDRRPHDILVLTGDIHTGRHAVGRIAGRPEEVHEFVASPASRIGPFIGTIKPHGIPGKLFPERRPSWTVWQTAADGSPTVDNHVGAVRMSPGTNRRVRFELELWRVRAQDTRNWFRRLTRGGKADGGLAPLFRREIELR